MIVRLVVPRRSDGEWRDQLWTYCQQHWQQELPDWELVEGHHDTGPFNRAAAINTAARGEWDVLVIVDGDVICDPSSVRAAVEQAHRTGRLTLPFHRRRLLGKGGTRQIILRGYQGPWDRFRTVNEGRKHYSSVVVVPRPLWDQVRGFDERFEGWGGEDDAFHAACNFLGGFDRLHGDVWHLWHPTSPHRDTRDALYQQAFALTERYWATKTLDGMRRLVEEDRGPDQIVVVVLTNGARDTLPGTLASAEEMLTGPIGRRVIANDSGHPLDYDGWEDVRIGRDSGYTRATAAAHRLAAQSGQPWVFFLEDDFTLNQPIDLTEVQTLMRQHPELVQISLKRQPWYPDEVDAGGIIEAKPDAFTQRPGYVEHRDYWAQNPMLTHRSVLCAHPWPLVAGSERAYAAQIFEDPERVAGILGHLEDPPRCTHTGTLRAGAHY